MENGIPLVSFFSSPSSPAAVEIFQQILFVFASFRLVLFGQNCWHFVFRINFPSFFPRFFFHFLLPFLFIVSFFLLLPFCFCAFMCEAIFYSSISHFHLRV